MGMFDSVYADCPVCGSKVEFQSKEGVCSMHSYTPEDAPTFVLLDVLNYPRYCRNCDNWMALVDPAIPPGPPPRPANVEAVKLRQPAADEITVHSSQSFIRWWEAEFSFEDIAPPKETTDD